MNKSMHTVKHLLKTRLDDQAIAGPGVLLLQERRHGGGAYLNVNLAESIIKLNLGDLITYRRLSMLMGLYRGIPTSSDYYVMEMGSRSFVKSAILSKLY